jgi:putative endonuclease
LIRRLYQHRSKLLSGFTSKYNINQLAYYEVCPTAMSAIEREKVLIGRTRARKIVLIESMNPLWDDLTASLSDVPPPPRPLHPVDSSVTKTSSSPGPGPSLRSG